MTVLVIGRTGQLARALAEQTDWRFAGRDDVDLGVPDAAAALIADRRPRLVVNAAAWTAVDAAECEEAGARRINAEAVAEIAGAAAAVAAPLIHISTDYVYDGRSDRPWRESDPTSPVSAYGRTKLAGERAALAANSRTVILRTAWVYAPWGRNFVRTMLRLAAERDEVRIVADQQGTPTSALDLARAVRRVAEIMIEAPASDPRWGIYHYAGRGRVSWAEFASAVFAEAEGRLIEKAPRVVPISSADYPTPAERPANSALDCERFERTFGLQAVPWQQALREVEQRIAEEENA